MTIGSRARFHPFVGAGGSRAVDVHGGRLENAS
jgi:hypothetical protein